MPSVARLPVASRAIEFSQPRGLLYIASVKTRLPSATSYTFFVWACPPYRRSGFPLVWPCSVVMQALHIRPYRCNPSRFYINASKIPQIILGRFFICKRLIYSFCRKSILLPNILSLQLKRHDFEPLLNCQRTTLQNISWEYLAENPF